MASVVIVRLPKRSRELRRSPGKSLVASEIVRHIGAHCSCLIHVGRDDEDQLAAAVERFGDTPLRPELGAVLLDPVGDAHLPPALAN